MTEQLSWGASETLDGSHRPDFVLWEQELKTEDDFSRWDKEFLEDEQLDDTELLERRVLADPEEPQTAWVESNADGTITDEQYRQQCYWVIGQYGHALDVLKDSITTEEQAEEWFDMKIKIATAKLETDIYKLATIRSDVMPTWGAYVQRMNLDYVAFERVRNK